MLVQNRNSPFYSVLSLILNKNQKLLFCFFLRKVRTQATSFGVSLLLFEPRSQKVRYNQEFTLDYNTTMAKEALGN
ncbi:hypothetical protein EAF07_06835 [Streptococcus hillyeri]|uniref:Uncharacterized protein n=1 Tax=Streptococcus hillyeri TaxID=2282420 RepID=A0A3L9DQA9_9STRE|nr:hypothetical protein EAF07_06835 [Streptococcus hillyeri]